MGQTAENLLETRTISREDQDRFALGSQRKAAAARARGRFAREIVPVSIPPATKGQPPGTVTEDEFIKPDTTYKPTTDTDTVSNVRRNEPGKT